MIIFLYGSCPLTVGLASRRTARLIVGIHIPALPWNLADAVPALRDVVPELLQVAGLRELPCHTNHCNWLKCRRGRSGRGGMSRSSGAESRSPAVAPGSQLLRRASDGNLHRTGARRFPLW